MKKMITMIFAVLTLMLLVFPVQPGAAQQRNSGPGARTGPPPEAYTACEGKSAGAVAQFEDPRGETVIGTCEEVNGTLVLRPDHPRGDSGGKRQGPPPEAYTACEGKSAGAVAQFEDPRGETVIGTCEEVNGTLVLRPDHPRGGSRGGLGGSSSE